MSGAARIRKIGQVRKMNKWHGCLRGAIWRSTWPTHNVTTPSVVYSKSFEMFVPGRCKPKGSPRPIRNQYTGKTAMVIDSDEARDWGTAIASEASRRLMAGILFPKGTPVRVDLRFVFVRPGKHYLPITRKRPEPVIRPDAPVYHTSYPDTDKLQRVVLDALTHGGLWHDDSQAQIGSASKVYGDRPGVHIKAYLMPGPLTVADRCS